MADPITVIAAINTGISLFKNVRSLLGGDKEDGDQTLAEIRDGIADLERVQKDILAELLLNRQTDLDGEALEVRQLAVSAQSDIRSFENGDLAAADTALSKISLAVAGLSDIDIRNDFLAVEVGGFLAVAYLDVINAAANRAFARTDIKSEINAIAAYLDRIVSSVRAEVNSQRAQIEEDRVRISFQTVEVIEGGNGTFVTYRGTVRIDGQSVGTTFSEVFVKPGDDLSEEVRDAIRDEFSSEINSFLRGLVPFPDVFDLSSSADTLRDLADGEDARLRFDNGDDTVTLGSGNDYADGLNGNDVIFGGAGDDSLRGGEENDTLHGQANDDVLNGEDGNDILLGGTGTNVLKGGAGVDTASYRDAGAGVQASLLSSREQVTGVSTDLFEGIEALEGSNFSDTLEGDTRANTLSGLGGNDTLLGGRGADRLIGGSGRDLLYGQGDCDTFVVQPSDALGGPTTLADLNFAEGDRIELIGFGSARIIGSVEELIDAGSDLGFSLSQGPGTSTTAALPNGSALIALPTLSFA
ncbi:MAG: calcium-binding protein, partial [Pseudomonadota bacterium]